MPRRFLLLALAALLGPAAALTQEAQPPAETKPAEPAKKPDAFKYFFGQKDKKDPKDSKDEKDRKAEAPEPAPAKAPEAPAPIAAPAPAPPPTPQPEMPKPAPRVDAFQYFFGRGAVAPAAGNEAKKPETGDKKPVDAFEFFFGKNGRAGGAGEPAQEPAKPPGS
jgi:hypothetical protein